MALGNSNPKKGDKGSRFNYELSQLRILNDILEALDNLELSFSGDLGDINFNTDNIENLLQGINGSVETPGLFRTEDDGTLAAGFFAISITNTSNVDCGIGGELGIGFPGTTIIKPGETFEWCAKTGNTLGSLNYFVAELGELLILTTKIV